MNPATTRKRVFLIEDEPRLRAGIAANIESQPDLALAGTAVTLAEALDWLERSEPDVVLCDLGLPDGSGVEAIRMCVSKYPNALVMVITIFGDDEHVFRSLEAGAAGYVLKQSSSVEVADQIRTLLDGGSPISPPIARRVLQRMRVASPGPEPVEEGRAGELSPREAEVLQLQSKGYSNAEVAAMISLSAHTITTYVRRIYRKLAVHSRAEAVF